MAKRRIIILEDGRQFCGTAFGADSDRVCEIVFNTSMVGYQEILSDPSYTDQAVVMTYPLIGNYGMAGDDYESFQPGIAAMIVREYNDEPSNFRSAETLESVQRRKGWPCCAQQRCPATLFPVSARGRSGTHKASRSGSAWC